MLLARSRELFRSAEDVQGEAEAVNSSGDLLAVTDVPRALSAYEQALRLARKAESPKDQVHALEGAARCHQYEGQERLALSRWVEAAALHRRMGTRPAHSASAILAAPVPPVPAAAGTGVQAALVGPRANAGLGDRQASEPAVVEHQGFAIGFGLQAVDLEQGDRVVASGEFGVQ